jgi:sugar phosphate isomerase/epimerase
MNSMDETRIWAMPAVDTKKPTSRRTFLKWTGFSGLGLLWPLRLSRFFPEASRGSFLDQIGVCRSLADQKILADGGCTYVEESVRGFLIPEEPDEKFQAKLLELKSSRLPVRACNGFLPGQLKAVGPEAKHAEILAYAEKAFQRAAGAGIETIVWGSGESRKIPDGFSRAAAEEQFSDVAGKAASLAGRCGVTIVLEPLNSGETNFINNLREGMAVVEAVGHPSFRLLADIYHMLREGEAPDAIETSGKYLRHCHIAEKDQRTPPGTAGDDFRPFLRALKKIGYTGGISIECRWESLEKQLPAAVGFLKKQIAEVAGSSE